MPIPLNQTPEEQRAEGERVASERRAADRQAAYLFSMQSVILGASEEDLRSEFPERDVSRVLSYRRGRRIKRSL